nr:hypothetical protein [Actinomycetota bacterium]
MDVPAPVTLKVTPVGTFLVVAVVGAAAVGARMGLVVDGAAPAGVVVVAASEVWVVGVATTSFFDPPPATPSRIRAPPTTPRTGMPINTFLGHLLSTRTRPPPLDGGEPPWGGGDFHPPPDSLMTWSHFRGLLSPRRRSVAPEGVGHG